MMDDGEGEMAVGRVGEPDCLVASMTMVLAMTALWGLAVSSIP